MIAKQTTIVSSIFDGVLLTSCVNRLLHRSCLVIVVLIFGLIYHAVPAWGYGIRYEHGMFEQRIKDGNQVSLGHARVKKVSLSASFQSHAAARTLQLLLFGSVHRFVFLRLKCFLKLSKLLFPSQRLKNQTLMLRA
jgi:hypothetical protein